MSNTPRRSTAAGTIQVTSYESSAYDAPDGSTGLFELRISETFTGDIVGDGTVRFLQALAADGTASFCGIERVRATIAGRTGTFLLQDAGTLAADQRVSGQWFVVPGSATGELAGLRGDGGFSAKLGEHAAYTLDYWFA